MVLPSSPIVLQLNAQGQLVIPIHLQTILNLKEGDTVSAYLDNNKLILEKTAHIKQQLKNRFVFLTESLADELIHERQQAAKQE